MKQSVFSTSLVIALFIACFLVTIIYTFIWTMACNEPFSIDYEGHVLWACQKLSQFENIYSTTALSDEPWSVVIYNPLYFVCGAALVTLFGVSFEPLRMLSMASALACFLSFGILLKRCRLNDFHTILTVLLFACSLPVLHWSTTARVDFLGLALAVISLDRFVKSWMDAQNENTPKLSIGAIIFSICAFFTKQQYFLFMLSCIIFAFAKKQNRLGLNYLIACLVPTVILTSIMQGITQGYWAHITYAAGLQWEWQTIELFIIPFLLDPKTIVSLVLIITAAFWTSKKPSENIDSKNSPESLAAILLVLSLGLACYTMGLRGAFHNHLLCTEFALFWLAALSLNKLPKAFGIPVLIAIALSLNNLLGYGQSLAFRALRRAETKETITMLQKKFCTKKILSEDPSLAIFAGITPTLVDATTMLNTMTIHKQDLKSLAQKFEQKYYSVVIINTHDADENRGAIWRGLTLDAILKNYKLIAKSGGNGMEQSVFVPK